MLHLGGRGRRRRKSIKGRKRQFFFFFFLTARNWRHDDIQSRNLYTMFILVHNWLFIYLYRIIWHVRACVFVRSYVSLFITLKFKVYLIIIVIKLKYHKFENLNLNILNLKINNLLLILKINTRISELIRNF